MPSTMMSGQTYQDWLNRIASEGWTLQLIQGAGHVHIFYQELAKYELH